MNIDAKYTTFEEIYTRIAALVKGKSLNPADILEWSVQCETEYIQSFASLIPYLKVKLPVRDRMARIPPYKTRIMDVYEDPENERSHVTYYDNGAYIVLPSEYKKDYVYINFMGIAIDPKSGIPFIKKGHEEACVYHCLVNLYLEDALNGRIDRNMYARYEERRDLLVRAAQSDYSDFDRRDLMTINAITLNMLPYINFDSLHHKTMIS